MMGTKALLEEKICEADFVFVGIGNEMQVKLEQLKEDRSFSEKLEFLEQNEKRHWVIPYLIRYYIEKIDASNIDTAYEKLLKLVSQKNYFIVSLSTDDLIYKHDFIADRVVLPCGGYRELQCAVKCTNEIHKIEPELSEHIVGWIEGKTEFDSLKEPICPICGNKLVFNQYGQPNYNEEGYLENWNRYKVWLQGTINKKLCIMELGVGMEFPSVIRWPMEKVCFYNQKSTFFRVHSSLYQLSKDIDERGYFVKENPISFLNQEDI